MSTMRLGAATVVVALCGLAGMGQAPAAQTTVSQITYNDFIKQDIKQRRELFREVSPENKAMIVQTHGKRWLERNRAHLTEAQAAAVQELVAFFTPERFRNPTEPSAIERERELTRQLRCLAGEEAFSGAFAVLHAPTPRRRTWQSVIDDSLEWLVDCVLP